MIFARPRRARFSAAVLASELNSICPRQSPGRKEAKVYGRVESALSVRTRSVCNNRVAARLHRAQLSPARPGVGRRKNARRRVSLNSSPIPAYRQRRERIRCNSTVLPGSATRCGVTPRTRRRRQRGVSTSTPYFKPAAGARDE